MHQYFFPSKYFSREALFIPEPRNKFARPKRKQSKEGKQSTDAQWWSMIPLNGNELEKTRKQKKIWITRRWQEEVREQEQDRERRGIRKKSLFICHDHMKMKYHFYTWISQLLEWVLWSSLNKFVISYSLVEKVFVWCIWALNKY